MQTRKSLLFLNFVHFVQKINIRVRSKHLGYITFNTAHFMAAA